MDRLRLIETFVRVVNAGSFSQVAREEQTTQSAISKQVQALEAQLGARLLVRSTRQHALTEAGQLFYERCLNILDALEEARIEVNHAEHSISGVLRVGAPVVFGRKHIVPKLAQFCQRYPNIKVNLQLDDSFVDLVQAGIDVAFRVGQLKDSRLIARRIATVQRATLASTDYLRRHGEPQSPQDLLRHNCLVYTGLATLNEWNFVGPDGQTHPIRVNGNFESNSSEAIRQAVCEGMGITYSAIWNFSEDLKRGRVQTILNHYPPPTLPLSVVYQPTRRPSLKVKSFVEYFAQALKNDEFIGPMMISP